MRGLLLRVFLPLLSAICVHGGLGVPIHSQSPPANSPPQLLKPIEISDLDKDLFEAIDGTIKLRLSIDKKGKVKKAEVVAGPMVSCDPLGTKDRDRVRGIVAKKGLEAEFSPAMKDGKPSDSSGVVTLVVGPRLKKAISRPAAEQKSVEDAAAPTNRETDLVDEGVVAGRAILLPKPKYPFTGFQKIGGQLRIEVIIDETGSVIMAGALDGLPDFQDAGIRAACQAKFSPTTIKGRPVKVTGTISYTFVP